MICDSLTPLLPARLRHLRGRDAAGQHLADSPPISERIRLGCCRSRFLPQTLLHAAQLRAESARHPEFRRPARLAREHEHNRRQILPIRGLLVFELIF